LVRLAKDDGRKRVERRMIRLDKNKIAKDSDNESAQEDTDEGNRSEDISIEAEESSSELEKYSLYVLKILMEENIPPTPLNYQIYFDKLLENKPLDFKKRINDLLESESVNDDEQRAKIEKEVKEGFALVKNIMKEVSVIYKNTNLMKEIAKKRKKELKANQNHLTAQNIVTAFENDLQKITAIFDKQLKNLKTFYERTSTILKEIENKAIFDSRFGVYNKRYFLQELKKEKENVEKFNHSSSVIAVKVKDEVLSTIVNSKERAVILRIVAKLLLRTSRRSDIVAHYGDGIFVMVLKHTDLSSAKMARDRIRDLITTTSFFLGEREVTVDLNIAIVEIDVKKSIEEIVSSALDAL